MATFANITKSKAVQTGLKGKALIDEEKKKILDIAAPLKAKESVSQAAQKGAFTLQPPEPVQPVTDYAQQLRVLGFSTGSPAAIQKLISQMAEGTAEQRIQKKKAQEALQGYSTQAGKGAYFENPNLETSSEQILKDVEKVTSELFEEGEKEKTRLEREIEVANQRDISEFERSRERGRQAESAATSAFAQGREQIVSETAPQIVQGFNAEISRQITNSKAQLDLAMQKRADLLTDLEKARADKNEKLQDSISESLAMTGNAIQKMQTDLANKQAANQSKALDFLKEMPAGTITGIGIDNLMAFGFDPATAFAMQNLDVQRMNAQLSDPDYITKMNQAVTSGMTTEQKNFMAYQDLLKSDPAQAQAFALKAGFADTLSAKEAFDQQLAWNKYALDYYDTTDSWPSKNGTQNSDGSIDDYSPVGADGGQCGEYVNNYYGTKLFGDTLANKKEKINSQVPIAGGAFISKYGYNLATIGQTGHVGLITKVYDDGSFDIKDSNRHGDEKVDTSHVTDPTTSGIIGYFDPSKTTIGWKPTEGLMASVTSYTPPVLPTGEGMGKQLTEKDAILSQIRAGNMTPTEITKSRKKAKNQGWLDEFTATMDSPKVKPLTVTDSTKYGVPAGITQYQFDEILAFREQQGLGNKTFQAFVNDTATDQSGTTEGDKLMKFIQLRENLEEAKKLYDDFKKEGGSLRSLWDKFGRVVGRTGEFVGTGTTKELDLYRRIQALTGDALVAYVKEISGVAVSEPEFERLKQYKPNIDMADSQFTDQLDRMMQEYDKSLIAKTKRFGFKDAQQMKDVIMGNVQADAMPSNVNIQVSDPLDISQPQANPLNLDL